MSNLAKQFLTNKAARQHQGLHLSRTAVFEPWACC